MFKTFLRELSPYAAVVLPNGNVSVTAGEAPKIDIVVESRMGHKTVTRIRGLESFGIGAFPHPVLSIFVIIIIFLCQISLVSRRSARRNLLAARV